MWAATIESLGDGRTIKTLVQCGGRPVPVTDVIRLWRDDWTFRTFFMGLLRQAPFDAYFWECRPMTTGTLARPFEFVLVDSPPLAAMPPDAQAFADRFEADRDAATFWNLGRDALLVAPGPKGRAADYTHLAAFTRHAPVEQQHALWESVGAAVAAQISAAPLWLSTSGLGIAWLHIRLDSRPKYYNHQPYRRVPA